MEARLESYSMILVLTEKHSQHTATTLLSWKKIIQVCCFLPLHIFIIQLFSFSIGLISGNIKTPFYQLIEKCREFSLILTFKYYLTVSCCPLKFKLSIILVVSDPANEFQQELLSTSHLLDATFGAVKTNCLPAF